MMKFIRGFILLLVMVLASQPVYASLSAGPIIFWILGILAAFALLGIILLTFIIISTVFLIQRRSTPARRKYGRVAEILSYIFTFPFLIFILAVSIAEGLNIEALALCAIVAIPGGLSAFLAHKVKKLPAEEK